MKALISTVAGGPETLTLGELPMPGIGQDDVLVRVGHCALNFPDLLIIADQYQVRPPRPFAPGFEVAGVVSAAGPGVSRFQPGQRVMGVADWGGCAEFVSLPESRCIAIPDDMGEETATALLFTYGTSLFALRQGELASGETLLVLGASGGIGLAAVELGKARGATVLAAVSSEAKAAIARKAGADAVIVYPAGPLDRDAQRQLGRDLKAACGPHGASVVCDPVGGDYAEPAFRAMAPGGRYLVVGFAAGVPKLPLNLPLLGNHRLIGVSFETAAAGDPGLRAAVTSELLDYWKQGRISPVISKVFPIEEAPKGLAMLAGRKATGKIIIRMAAA